MSRFNGMHLEPVWWGLFSAGGICFAMFVPAAIIVFGVLAPAGLIELNVTQLASWFSSIWGLFFVGAVICLPAFHAAHRIRHGLHDLKSGGGLFSVIICYGVAALLSASVLLAWLSA
jgi:fumarate reductase subunit D